MLEMFSNNASIHYTTQPNTKIIINSQLALTIVILHVQKNVSHNNKTTSIINCLTHDIVCIQQHLCYQNNML